MITIHDITLDRVGTVISYDGSEATVQWHTHWYVTGVTRSKLESGRYTLKGN